ncbi:hypothetical protein GYB29_07450 [bacterium]|nr:hypothetical protein [bacterium]
MKYFILIILSGLIILISCKKDEIQQPSTQDTLSSNDHIEYFGFTLVDTYWDDPTDNITKTNYSDEVHSFSNMADILVVTPTDYIIDRIDSMVNLNMKAVLHLNEIFFEVSGNSSPSGTNYNLRPDYQQRWDDFVTTNSLQSNASKILTFYIGEEPTWNGISFNDFSAATNYVKNQFPNVPIMMVEAYPVLDSLQVPQSVDWLGFDHYFIKDPMTNTTFQQEWAKLKSKRSATSQKLVVIMDSHYISWAHGTWGNISLSEMDDVAESYYQLAISEQLVIAIFGYYWPNSFEFPEAIGARGMPQNVMDKYIEIGKEISGKN